MAYLFQNYSGLAVHAEPTFYLTGYIQDNGKYNLVLSKPSGYFGAHCEVRLYFKNSSGSYTLCRGPQPNGALLYQSTSAEFWGGGSSNSASVSAEGTASMVDTSDGGSFFISMVCGFYPDGGQVASPCSIYSNTTPSGTRDKRKISIVIPDYDGGTYNCSETFFLLQEVEQVFSEGYITLQYYRPDPTKTDAIIRVEYFGSANKYWAGTKKSSAYSSSVSKKAKVKAPMTTTHSDWTNTAIGSNVATKTDVIYMPYVAYARVVEELKEGTNHLMKAEASIDAAETPPAELKGMSCLITGTTISMKPHFEGVSGPTGSEAEDAANKNWTARLGKFKTSAADDAEGYAKFQLLTNGITYTIIFGGIMKEYNSGNTGGGNTIVDTSEVGYDVTTYKLTFEEFNVETNRFQAVAYQTVGQYGETDHAMTFLGAMSYKAFCRQRYGSNVIGGDVSKVDGAETYISKQDRGETSISSATAVVTTKYLEPFTSYRLYGYLHSRVSSGTRYYCVDFVGDFDAVCYLDFTTLQVAIPGQFKAKVTGRTVTVTPVISRWNGSESITILARLENETDVIIKPVTITPWQNRDIVFTGLNNATKYTITFEAHDNGVLGVEGGTTIYNEINIDPIEVVTYGIDLTLGQMHSRYVEGNKIFYTDGENASNVSQDMSRAGAVKWQVSLAASGIATGTVIPPTTLNCRRINPNTFDTMQKMLQPDTEYVLTAYIDGVIFEGGNDTLVTKKFKTLKAAYNLTAKTCATGTTIGVMPEWVESNSPRNTTTVKVTLQHPNGRLESQEVTYPYADVWFTGLKRGENYPIYITASDVEGSTTDDFIGYASVFSGSGNETTYKISIDEGDYQVSTRSIKFKMSCNRQRPATQWNPITSTPSSNPASIQYYIHQPSLGAEGNYLDYSLSRRVNAGTDVVYTNLAHNTEVEIGYKIYGMYDRTGISDTEEIFKVKTKLLTLQYVSHETHVHSLIVNWQCRVEGQNYDKDPISGTNIVFVNHGYIIETTEDKEIHHHFGEFAYRSDTDGNTVVTTGSGSYTTKKWTYTGLESGRIYTCCATVTDGRNSVSNWAHGRYNIKTLNNMVRIWDSHTRTWRRGIPYIYHNRKWMDCSTTHLYHNGKWWECDPERIPR